MKTLQTGTKVLIEATVEMTDGKDDTTLVRFKTSGCYWMDTSDLTVCETAEVDPNNWQVKSDDPDFTKVGEALKFKDINWWNFKISHRKSVGIVCGIKLYNIVSPVPTITGQQALKLLGVSDPIDLNNFCIDITNPVNAELLPGFMKTIPNYIQDKRYKFYGKQNGYYFGNIGGGNPKLTTLPELQKQHPGVFEPQQNDEWRPNNGESKWEWTKQTEWHPTPSFKAGQEVTKHGDKIHALKVSEWVDAIYCCPHPNQTSALKHIVTDVDSIITWSTSAIRPIPAQPTVESEILAVLEKCAGGQCGQKFTLTTESGLLQILDILNRHQKHSGRVDVSVPTKEEIMSVFSRNVKDSPTVAESYYKAVEPTVRHFMTRKEQQG